MESLVDKVERVEQRRRKWRKIRNITMLIIVAVLLAGGSFYYYFPFAKGIKTGRLNYVVYKGILFKTYEGRLIQSGIRPSADGGIQSNEFMFSVSDEAREVRRWSCIISSILAQFPGAVTRVMWSIASWISHRTKRK